MKTFLRAITEVALAAIRKCCSKWMSATLLKKETLAQVFSCEFCKVFQNTFLKEHLRWLLLTFGIDLRSFRFVHQIKLFRGNIKRCNHILPVNV